MSTPLRQFINATLREVARDCGDGRILNAGARHGETDREGRPYSEYFPAAETWTTIDKRAGADFTVDLNCESVAGWYDLILCISVLEHCEYPEKAVKNLRETMAEGGHLFVSVPFLYPYHPAKDFGDYWRFTADGLRLLFAGMTEVWLRTAPGDAGFCALFKEAT